MSAFFVGNTSISKIANEIAREENRRGKKLEAEEFARTLYDMNVEALVQRYDEKIMKEQVFAYEPNVRFESKEQFYQSLQRYLYRCSEGTVPESELFKVVKEKSNELAHEFARKAADEAGAEWE